MNYCASCDPQYFVVYGYCPNCLRMCEPPLVDWLEMSPLDAQQLHDDWNAAKDDWNAAKQGKIIEKEKY